MNAYYQYFLASGEEVRTPSTPSTPAPVPVTPTSPSVELEPVAPTAEPVAEEPATTLGDNTIQPVDDKGTTINIYGSGTSSTHLGEELTIDTATGEIISSTGGGYGGGGGGGLFGDSNSKSAMLPFGKTIIPLAVMAAGAAILILKPIK
jgi:hypothetical protein